MRVLLLQPEDSARRGPWTAESWDLMVDLGRSSSYASGAWSEKMGCPVLRLDSSEQGIADVRRMAQILAFGQRRLLDSEGIDWWSLASLEIVREASAIFGLQRLAAEVPRAAKLWSTRPGWPAEALAQILGRPLKSFGANLVARGKARAKRYGWGLRHFSAAQLKEIFLDKYDPDYGWRARFVAKAAPAQKPVVLIPSAYTNVSRVASAYARLLPEQTFLLVATRRSATLFDAPPNVHLRGLAGYAQPRLPERELSVLLEKWAKLHRELRDIPDLRMLDKLGVFDPFSDVFKNGLGVRNAWREVLQREPVCGVLCGDDTAVNSRLPVLLAARRGLPTLDFHHGAMDGFYLVKELSSDLYLAKNEMERDYLRRICGLAADRVVLGAPFGEQSDFPRSNSRDGTGRTERTDRRRATKIVFFSEPYENVGMRTEEVYREVLPLLGGVARQTGKQIVLKLHPFEMVRERSEIVRSILTASDFDNVTVVSGPLSEDLLSQTWAGMTVESTTVLDCVVRGIPCFLCGWRALSPFGYLQQYARFGAGEVLEKKEEIADIPRRLLAMGELSNEERGNTEAREAGFRWQPVDPRLLAQWLGAESCTPAVRSA